MASPRTRFLSDLKIKPAESFRIPFLNIKVITKGKNIV
jgi:hypothetical protein